MKQEYILSPSGRVYKLAQGLKADEYLSAPCRTAPQQRPLATLGWTKCEPPPSLQTMMRWADDGMAEATDGCTCPHGCKSWLLVCGVI